MYFVVLSSIALRRSSGISNSSSISASFAASVGQARDRRFDVELLEVVRHHRFVQRERRQRADADFEAVRRRGAAIRVVLHVPQMAELMLRAGDGPAGTRGLHREAGDHERRRQPARDFQVAACERRRDRSSTRRSRDCTISQISRSIASMPKQSASIQSAPAGHFATRSA